MTFKRRITNIVVGIFFILSLLVSSVSACTCSLHEHSEQTETHSHHSHQKESGHHDQSVESSGSSVLVMTDSECCCVSPAPKVTIKSETIRLDGRGLTAEVSTTSLEPEFVPLLEAVATNFDTRIVVSDLHYHSSPGRAPPRL